MPYSRKFLAALALACIAWPPITVSAQTVPAEWQADEAAIRKVAAQYIDAQAKSDTKALAAAWTANGTYIDADGKSVNAREAIQQYVKAGENPPPREIKIRESHLRFLAADVAIEDGISENSSPDGETAGKIRYTAIWVRRDGSWLLDSVREHSVAEADPGARAIPADLGEMAAFVGEWSAKVGNAAWTFSNEFIDDRQVLRRRYAIREGDRTVVEGTQYITIEPNTGEIISHAVDSQGTTTDGVWTLDRADGSWTVDYRAQRADGAQVRSTQLYIPQDKAWSWTVLNSTVDGKPVPDFTMKMVLQSSK